MSFITDRQLTNELKNSYAKLIQFREKHPELEEVNAAKILRVKEEHFLKVFLQVYNGEKQTSNDIKPLPEINVGAKNHECRSDL
ncbi:MAG: hypothetical protein V7735_06575 [Photobacterium frigidiphilum]|uniref:hypothetical protein n=1 Tax=Photobacterium frigidiphilum TaxID=264736 RepID=UPI0030035375